MIIRVLNFHLCSIKLKTKCALKLLCHFIQKIVYYKYSFYPCIIFSGMMCSITNFYDCNLLCLEFNSNLQNARKIIFTYFKTISNYGAFYINKEVVREFLKINNLDQQPYSF